MKGEIVEVTRSPLVGIIVEHSWIPSALMNQLLGTSFIKQPSPCHGLGFKTQRLRHQMIQIMPRHHLLGLQESEIPLPLRLHLARDPPLPGHQPTDGYNRRHAEEGRPERKSVG